MQNEGEAAPATVGAPTDLSLITDAVAELKSELKGDHAQLGQEIN